MDGAFALPDIDFEGLPVAVVVTPDPARMRRLVEQHFDFVWRSVRRFGVPEANAEDAAQEVFIVASRKVGPVAVDRERAFLFAVAMRVASGFRRTSRRHPDQAGGHEQPDHASAQPAADELLDRTKARALLDQIVDGLPEDSRAVFVLFEIEEMTMIQIAELLQLPQGTVASRLRRAREQFAAGVARYQARARTGEVR